jgi:hypothetical protein
LEDIRLTMTSCLADGREDFIKEIEDAKTADMAYGIIEKTLNRIIDLCFSDELEKKKLAEDMGRSALTGAAFIKSQGHPTGDNMRKKTRKGIKAKFFGRRIFLIILGVLMMWGTLIFALSPYGGLSKDLSPMFYVFFILGALCLFMAGNLNLGDSIPVGEKDMPIVMDPIKSYATLVEIAILIDEKTEDIGAGKCAGEDLKDSENYREKRVEVL